MLNSIILFSTCLIYYCSCSNVTEADKWFNFCLDGQNPSSVLSPKTDNGAQPPFKYPFSFAHRGQYSGGWTRQVTVRDLPVATGVAGVQMRLFKGAIRELHWHTSSEWAYMIYGQARITLIDENGLAFVDDVQAGDLWLFPSGRPHSIQGIGDDGALFLLVFNDGNFNEFGTLLLTDFMNHIPRDVLAKNFQVPKSVFNNLPKEPLYMFAAEMPLPLETEIAQATKVTGPTPQSFSFYTDRMKPNITRNGGSAKIIDAKNFPVTNIAAAIITLKPGAMRELHWHPNADEWQYYVKGKARMTVFAGNGEARTMDFQEGDVGYVQRSLPHYFENTGDCDLLALEVFPAPYFEDISLAQWLAHLPTLLVNQHIRTGEKFINSINKREQVIVPV